MVDIDIAELKKPLVKPDLAINANLEDFLPLFEKKAAKIECREWLDFCRNLKEKYSFKNTPEYEQKGEKNDSNTFMDVNRNCETTLRRNAYRESRNSRVYDDNVYEIDRYGDESYDDRRRDPSYGIPKRSMIYPAGFNTGVRDKVVKRYGKVCHICGGEIKSENDLTLDHIPPLAERFNAYEWKFPQWKRNEYYNDINYLKPAHKSCNSKTGSGGIQYDDKSLLVAMSDKHFSEGIAGWDKILPEYNDWMRSKFQNEK